MNVPSCGKGTVHSEDICVTVVLHAGLVITPGTVTTGSGLTERRFCHVAIVSSSPKREVGEILSPFFSTNPVLNSSIFGFLKKYFNSLHFKKRD